MNDKPVRIWLADDHALVLDGIELVLSLRPDLKIIGRSLNGDDLIAALGLHDIDLVISDLRMPGGLDGLTLMTRIKERHPAVKLLVVSMSDELEIVNRLFVAEVDGYILKNSGKDELLAAIDDVLDDRVHFEQALLTRILARQRELAKGTIAPQKPMSDREREVLELILQEHTSKQIAEKLFISKQTVDSHRLRIMEKTGARTLVGLIKYAVANGML
ncbi:MAG: response regulator transcription factor [Flavobacteriales bacterium]